MKRLSGKIAIVIGASSGIGKRTAELMAQEGAKVTLASRNKDSLQKIADGIRKSGGEALVCPTDLADEGQIRNLIERTASHFGGITVLVNISAATDPTIAGPDASSNTVTLDPEIWQKTMTINMNSVMLAMRFAIPHMVKSGGGSIVNISSTAGQRGFPSMPAYTASKGAIDALTRHVAAAFGKQGIRCNSVSPGYIDKGPSAHRAKLGDLPAKMLHHMMTARLGVADDIAYAALYLASDESGFVTGQLLAVDGGNSILYAGSDDMFPGIRGL